MSTVTPVTIGTRAQQRGLLRQFDPIDRARDTELGRDVALSTLEGDLTIQYEESMQYADFDNAVYVLLR